jgi:uncharacterized PurR-regulated membrane protein YhhQ (DUF165 family)
MIFVVLYLLSVIAANLIVTALGPSVSIITAFFAIGLSLTTRDKIHELWHNKGLFWKMLLLIMSGGIISVALNLNSWRIGLASCVAFIVSEGIDTIIYQLFYKKEYAIKVSASNVCASLSDSLVFPTLAFGSIMPLIILGQFIAKVAGGALWMLILKKKNVVQLNQV